MKPAAISVASLLFLVVLILSAAGATGIRLLEEKSVSALHNKFQEKSPAGGGGGVGVGQECGPPGHCSGTSSRKLINTAKASAESKESSGTGVDNARGNQHHSKENVGSSRSEDLHVQPPLSSTSIPSETYPDVMDIAGMDYSPAKRKPPIHN